MNIATPSLDLDITSFVGKMIALLGITGSGKTNTSAVLIEELLIQGLPMTIVDIEGEYYGLKEKYHLLVAGRSEHAELEVTPENAGALAQASVLRGLSVILDLSDYTQEETYEFLVEYFKSLWESASKVKQPYQIILEEAHEWIPQGASTPLKQLLTRIALRGRKRGLGIILMSQRSAKVEKDVLTQAPLLFLHKVVHPTDMRVYKDLIPLPAAQVEEMVGALQPGQVVIVSNNVPQVAQIRLRHTFHAGSTPTLGGTTQPKLQQVDASLLKELQQMIASSPSQPAKDEKRFEKKIREIEDLLAERDATIADQKKQIELLSRLQVSMDGKITSSVKMPETMRIDQATIDKATVHQVHAAQPPRVVEASPVKRIAKPNKTSPALPETIQRRFTVFKTRIGKLDPVQQNILRLLFEVGRPLLVRDIALQLGAGETTIRDHLTNAFLRTRLLTRQHGARGGIYYTSAIRTEVQKNFPPEYTEALLRQLF